MTTDKTLDLALEALATEEYRLRQTGQSQVYSGIGFAIKAIKQARALDKKAENARELGLDYEPVQEPVAWLTTEVTTGTQVWLYEKTAARYQNPPTPLYTTPPATQRQSARSAWVGLTDEDWKELHLNTNAHTYGQAIEAKLKEKNT